MNRINELADYGCTAKDGSPDYSGRPMWSDSRSSEVDRLQPPMSCSRLEFGIKIQGRSEVIVTIDLFGLNVFLYDPKAECYIKTPDSHICNFRLSNCSNRETRIDSWPGVYSVMQYLERGYDSLCYLDAVSKQPYMAEYLDNPGLFILLMESSRARSLLVDRRLNRKAILQSLLGLTHVNKAHIEWLKKVRPKNDPPGELSKYIKKIVTDRKLFNSDNSNNSIYNDVYKVFHHQRSWSYDGLKLVSMLLERDVQSIADCAWLLDSRNGNENSAISKARFWLIEMAEDDEFPEFLRGRIMEVIRNHDALTPEFAKNLLKFFDSLESEKEPEILDLMLLFLSDDDIPRPVIPGNLNIEHLDTFEKIRRQARLANNCLWSIRVVRNLIDRKVDLYSVRGKLCYTLSISRESLSIRELEAANRTDIDPDDLGLIYHWHSTNTNSRAEGIKLPV